LLFFSACLRRVAGTILGFSRSHHVIIRVYDQAGNVIETHEHAGEFKEWSEPALVTVPLDPAS